MDGVDDEDSSIASCRHRFSDKEGYYDRYMRLYLTLVLALLVLSECMLVAAASTDNDDEPFELFENFDIGHILNGNEGWWDILYKRRSLTWPSLSFYEDKVALKRWLPANGFPIPRIFALSYASELECNDWVLDQQETIRKMLSVDNRTDYVAKPSHKAESYDVWIVNHYTENADTVLVSNTAQRFIEIQDFDTTEIAGSLARSLYQKADNWESRALLNVEPGFVVEERFTSWDKGSTRCDTEDEPAALEFKAIVIWGKLWVAQWYCAVWKERWNSSLLWDPGAVDRNGNMVPGSYAGAIPDWVDWSRIVDIAERLGAHKDMLRVDIFAGVPAGSPSLKEGATDEERLDATQYVVSELEFFPATLLDEELLAEGARLWIEGYKSGNYRVITNTEVPDEYLETHQLSHVQ